MKCVNRGAGAGGSPHAGIVEPGTELADILGIGNADTYTTAEAASRAASDPAQV